MCASLTVGNIELTFWMEASMSRGGAEKEVSWTFVMRLSCVLGVDGLVTDGVIISCKVVGGQSISKCFAILSSAGID